MLRVFRPIINTALFSMTPTIDSEAFSIFVTSDIKCATSNYIATSVITLAMKANNKQVLYSP